MHGIAHWIVYLIGFAAQFFFAGRTAFQWLYSERKHTVTSPAAYWGLSVAGAFLMFIYGVLRDDFPIVLGQLISYSVYLWNLDAKGMWKQLGKVVRAVLILTPVIAVVLLLNDAGRVFDNMFRNENIPLGLVIFGSAGQAIFTLRVPTSGDSNCPVAFTVTSSRTPPTVMIPETSPTASDRSVGVGI